MKGIYYIKNITTNQYYVGKTFNLGKRKIQHFSNLRKQRHENSHLQRSFNKYGEEKFIFEILFSIKEIEDEELCELEMSFIEKFDSFKNGFNLTIGGEGTQKRVFSNEERRRISERMKGKSNPFYGKKHSEETRKKLSLLSSKKVGDKNPFYGKTHASDWKEKRQELYQKKISEGWIDPKKGIKKPKDSIELMKKNMPTKKEIIVDNTEYQSISDCSQQLSISRRTIRRRLESEKFPNYRYKTENA